MQKKEKNLVACPPPCRRSALPDLLVLVPCIATDRVPLRSWHRSFHCFPRPSFHPILLHLHHQNDHRCRTGVVALPNNFDLGSLVQSIGRNGRVWSLVLVVLLLVVLHCRCCGWCCRWCGCDSSNVNSIALVVVPFSVRLLEYEKHEW